MSGSYFSWQKRRPDSKPPEKLERARKSYETKNDLWNLAEGRAGKIVKGSLREVIDGSIADQLGEPVAELRACMSDNVATPDAVAQVAVEQWLADPVLREMLLGRWERIGTGFDWACPTERGVVLVALLAGGVESREG